MVRVGFPGGPRLEWYDRNPSDESLYYQGAGVAPHTVVVRATYTVPSGKKAFVAAVSIEVMRRAAATSEELTMAWATWAGAICPVAMFWNKAMDARERADLTVQAVLAATESIQLKTADASPDGTVDYSLGVVITEFSA